MATKQSRALRSKQKAKAARIHKQKNQAIFSHDESNEAYEIISPKTIEMFESLPNPTVPKDGTAPITFLPPQVQGFLKTYDHEKISEDNIDRLVDAVLVAVGLYLYWGTSGNTVVPLSAIYQGANLIASIPESVPLIQAEIRQFLADQK